MKGVGGDEQPDSTSCLNSYALKILNNRASVTMRVLHKGHSRVELMMSSEHPLHIAICLCGGVNMRRMARNQDHPPAIDDRDVRLLILANNTKAVPFEIYGHTRPTSKCESRLRGGLGIHGTLLLGRGWHGGGRGHVLRVDGRYRLVSTVRICQNFRALSKDCIRDRFGVRIGRLQRWLLFVESLCVHAHFQLHPPEAFLLLFHLSEHLLTFPFSSFVCDEGCYSLNQIRLLDQKAGVYMVVEEDFLQYAHG